MRDQKDYQREYWLKRRAAEKKDKRGGLYPVYNFPDVNPWFKLGAAVFFVLTEDVKKGTAKRTDALNFAMKYGFPTRAVPSQTLSEACGAD